MNAHHDMEPSESKAACKRCDGLIPEWTRELKGLANERAFSTVVSPEQGNQALRTARIWHNQQVIDLMVGEDRRPVSEHATVKLRKMLPAIPNKREYLARVLGWTGMLRLIERAAVAWRPWLVVLTYHRIAEPGADRFYDPVISATPASFRAQIRWLRNHVRLLTLDELIGRVQTDSFWQRAGGPTNI